MDTLCPDRDNHGAQVACAYSTLPVPEAQARLGVRSSGSGIVTLQNACPGRPRGCATSDVRGPNKQYVSKRWIMLYKRRSPLSAPDSRL